MDYSRAIKTITQARQKLAKGMLLEFAGAICHDYKLKHTERMTLGDTYKYFNKMHIKEAELIQSLINHFIAANEYKQVSLNLGMVDAIPNICSVLIDWGFANNEQ